MLTSVIIGTIIHQARQSPKDRLFILALSVIAVLVLLITRFAFQHGGYCNLLTNTVLESRLHVNLRTDFVFTPIRVSRLPDRNESNHSVPEVLLRKLLEPLSDLHDGIINFFGGRSGGGPSVSVHLSNPSDHYHAFHIYDGTSRINKRIPPTGVELTTYLKRCKRILYRATERPPSSPRPDPDTLQELLHNNHLLYAIRNDACIVDIACSNHKPLHSQGKDQLQKLRHVLEVWRTDHTKNPNDLAVHFNPISAATCGAGLEPYFYKFIGLLALIENWISQWHTTSLLFSPPKPIEFMYLDNDVAFTTLSPNRDWLVDGPKLIRANSKIPPSAASNSYVMLNSDYFAFDNRTKWGYLPINTGVLIGRVATLEAGYELMKLIINTLLLPHGDPDSYMESLTNFWDTDQGALTHVLGKQYGLQLINITRQGSSPFIIQSQLSDHLSAYLLHPRELAPVNREFLARHPGHEDVEWTPGSWMVHLTPGVPHYKVQTWRSMCTNVDERIGETAPATVHDKSLQLLCSLSKWQPDDQLMPGAL